MRTVLFILGGFVLLALCHGAARLVASGAAGSMRFATTVFLALWLVIAGGNMWMGVNRAGYGVSEELPVFLLLFGLPAIGAILIKWKFL